VSIQGAIAVHAPHGTVADRAQPQIRSGASCEGGKCVQSNAETGQARVDVSLSVKVQVTHLLLLPHAQPLGCLPGSREAVGAPCRQSQRHQVPVEILSVTLLDRQGVRRGAFHSATFEGYYSEGPPSLLSGSETRGGICPGPRPWQ